MRIFVTKAFRRFQRKENIGDSALRHAIQRAERQNIDAKLGGCLIKQRVARKGQGRRSGYRTIIAYHTAERSVFLYGFAKNDKDNISPSDERALDDFGKFLLKLNGDTIEDMLIEDKIMEIDYYEED